jgi:glycosyltransferase involved in cell wall biosynthesis
MDHKISIIVPTYQGAHKIGVLLTALQAQSVLSMEVIVVIDGSTDSTAKVVASFNSCLPIRILQQKNQGRSIAKNNGARIAKGDILIFYDDDMEPGLDGVKSHAEFHKDHEGILTASTNEIVSSDKSDIENHKAFNSKKWMEKYSMGLNKLNSFNLFFTAANSSFKRRDFEKLSGFNESLTDAEDIEIAWRALKSKLDVYFDRANFAIHHDKLTCRSYIRRQREYRSAQSKVHDLHSDFVRTDSEVRPLKKFVFNFFSCSLFPWFIDTFNIFLLFPKKLRYKIYDLIIHSLSNVYPGKKI